MTPLAESARATVETPPDSADAPARIAIRDLSKRFGPSTIYDGFDLDLPTGATVAIFGPNGCGKSTLINMIAGMTPRDGGMIRYDDKPIEKARIGYVFQNYRDALFPWMRARDNIGYPLVLRGVKRAERERRIDRLVASFDVTFDLLRYPYELSGGQQQTVSIMRALVIEPDILLLDEPFSALDYEMTLTMRDQLQRALGESGATALLVSHDLDEAIYLADKLLLLTRRPTRVAAFLDIPIARPRVPETTTSPAFTTLKAEALGVFQKSVKDS